MQVARAATNLPSVSNPADSISRPASYAPLYLTSTLGNISFDIEELEGIALDRLKVLKESERARSATLVASGSFASKIETIRSATRAAERTYGLNIPPHTNPDRESRILKDQASHFLVRLALCKTHEHRTWLLATECDLFSTRLDGTGAEFALRAIEKANGPVVKPIPPKDLESIRAELDAVARGPNRQKGDAGTRYYKVPFEEVPALVRHRKVYLRDGVAYVPESNVLDIVLAQFRSKLNQGMMMANKAIGLADGDRRMRPILESIRQHFAAEDDSKKAFDASQSIDNISISQLNESIVAMPLCMTNMMQKLRSTHHLRYAARLQLGVFLKGCGLTMDESISFWKTEFGKGDISSDKFEKNYAYNIRHQYGKEGKRRNLQPFACMRVINDRPGPGEHNGCPYREFQDSRLKQALRGAGVDPNAVKPIVAKAAEGNFQLACGMCFSASQPGPHGLSESGLPEYIPNHPNEYFIEARRRRIQPADTVMGIDDEIDDEEMISAALAAETVETGTAEDVASPEDVRDTKAIEAPKEAEDASVVKDAKEGEAAQDVEIADAAQDVEIADATEANDATKKSG